MQLCVFDMKRGLEESDELDKILFFWPSDTPLHSQQSVVGLSEGLITFTRLFSPKAPCDLMEAERHTHLFYQCEPDIWMVMVVEKGKDKEESPRPGALRAVLEEAHDLFLLVFGSIRTLLLTCPGGDVARRYLHAFFPDYLSDFVAWKKLRLPSTKDSLTERGFIQFLHPQPEALLHALSLRDLLKSLCGGEVVRHVLILFQNMMLTSSLPQGDTATLFRYATLRMMPSRLSQSQSGRNSSLREQSAFMPTSGPFSSINLSNTLGHSRIRNFFTNLSTTYQVEETTEPPTADLDGATGGDQRMKSHVPRPLSQQAWWRGGDGFLDTDAWGTGGEGINQLPLIWLHQSVERMHLCVFQYKSLTILMLVPTSSGLEVITSLKGHLLEQAMPKIHKLEERLVKQWPGSNAWHVAGYRYLYCDWDNRVSKFSPASKVGTLSKESLSALNQIRAEIDLETGRIERNTGLRDRDFEWFSRSKQNTWIVVRGRERQHLYIVLEKASNSLVLAYEAAEKLNKQHFDGFFSSE